MEDPVLQRGLSDAELKSLILSIVSSEPLFLEEIKHRLASMGHLVSIARLRRVVREMAREGMIEEVAPRIFAAPGTCVDPGEILSKLRSRGWRTRALTDRWAKLRWKSVLYEKGLESLAHDLQDLDLDLRP